MNYAYPHNKRTIDYKDALTPKIKSLLVMPIARWGETTKLESGLITSGLHSSWRGRIFVLCRNIDIH